MNAIERQVAEIKKFQKAIEKSKSAYLKNDYSKYITTLKNELREYCGWCGINYKELVRQYDI